MDARHPDIWIGDTNTGQEFTQTWPAVVFVNALPRCGTLRHNPPVLYSTVFIVIQTPLKSTEIALYLICVLGPKYCDFIQIIIHTIVPLLMI